MFAKITVYLYLPSCSGYRKFLGFTSDIPIMCGLFSRTWNLSSCRLFNRESAVVYIHGISSSTVVYWLVFVSQLFCPGRAINYSRTCLVSLSQQSGVPFAVPFLSVTGLDGWTLYLDLPPLFISGFLPLIEVHSLPSHFPKPVLSVLACSTRVPLSYLAW